MLSLQHLLLILFSLGQVSAQHVHNNVGRRFPQWLTGLIAMTVFLFLVLVVYVAKMLWKKRSQSGENIHAYENPIEVNDNVRTTAM
ncbi:hypothetical protein XENTR_v10012014 [Xenopus tropicalis]|nr:hypothetical protein XENTR_v10012014 [Xenopus tropicalis]